LRRTDPRGTHALRPAETVATGRNERKLSQGDLSLGYLFGANHGRHRGLKFDHELLYSEAVFHDLGLTVKYRSGYNRFEIDSANAALAFLRANGIDEAAVGVVWDVIAL
jgi:hypothetical protein